MQPRIARAHFLALILLAFPAVVLAQPGPPQPLGSETQGRLEYLTRGPIHEAFASPADLHVETTLEIPDPPQGVIEEAPPPISPGEPGLEPLWIPGYWGWSVEQKFIWISGTWRYSPPGMRWIPGYWARTGETCRWVPGFWLSQDVQRVTYLPPPPPPRDEEIPQARPREDAFWVPGCWLFQGDRYAWRPGFWSESREDWVWVPCQHVWTPQGYVFVDGYWDYPLEDRGLLFAPVTFLAGWRGGTYVPQVLLDMHSVLDHFFIRPSYHHYCFGDYYGLVETGRDLVSWVSFASRPGHFDPLAVYYRTHRHPFFEQIQARHRTFVQRPEWRPPSTWTRYQRFFSGRGERGRPEISPLGLMVGQALRTGQIHGLRLGERRPGPPDRGGPDFREILRTRMQLEQRARDRSQPPRGVELRLPGVSAFERERIPPRGPSRTQTGPGDFRPGQPGRTLPGAPQITPPRRQREQPGQARPSLPPPPGRGPATQPGQGRPQPPGADRGKGRPELPPGIDRGKGPPSLPDRGKADRGKGRPTPPELPRGVPPRDVKDLPTPPGGLPKGPPSRPPGLKDRDRDRD